MTNCFFFLLILHFFYKNLNIFPKTNGAKQLETEVWSIKHFCIGRFPGMKSPFGLLLFELKISKNRRCRTYCLPGLFYAFVLGSITLQIWCESERGKRKFHPVFIYSSEWIDWLHTTWRYSRKLCGSVAVVTLYNAIIFWV